METQVASGVPIPPITERGRPKGSGKNIELLNQIKPGDTSSCILSTNHKRINSLRVCAQKMGIKIVKRTFPDGTVGIWRKT